MGIVILDEGLEDEEWCSVYGYRPPKEHSCTLGVCFNPNRDGMVLRGSLVERLARAEEAKEELKKWR